VSGALPETERERQVRELASRLLTHPDPDGPVTVDLLPLGYPQDLPPDLVDRTDLRFLGSAVRRRAGELTGVELVFEGPEEPASVLERYEAELLPVGWVRLENMGPVRGGFESRGFGDMAVLINESKTAMITLHALDREAGGSDLRVRYDIGRVREMLAMQQGMTRETSVLPVLRPPPGMRMRSEGHGGDGRRWSSSATAETDVAPMELEAYFAKQLDGAGWGRMDGSADEFFAWSGWLVPNVPTAPEWRGVLLVLAAFPGWRQVSVSAELVKPGGSRPHGGYAVSGLIG
jgi:hypothetical protein